MCGQKESDLLMCALVDFECNWKLRDYMFAASMECTLHLHNAINSFGIIVVRCIWWALANSDFFSTHSVVAILGFVSARAEVFADVRINEFRRAFARARFIYIYKF